MDEKNVVHGSRCFFVNFNRTISSPIPSNGCHIRYFDEKEDFKLLTERRDSIGDQIASFCEKTGKLMHSFPLDFRGTSV